MKKMFKEPNTNPNPNLSPKPNTPLIYRTTIVCDFDIMLDLKELAIMKEKKNKHRYSLKTLITTALIEFMQRERNDPVNYTNPIIDNMQPCPDNLKKDTSVFDRQCPGQITKPIVTINPTKIIDTPVITTPVVHKLSLLLQPL